MSGSNWQSAPSRDSFAPGRSYGAKIGRKALNGFANIGTSVLEIPKNIINVTNESNILYGVTGGLFKGILNLVGRTGVGVADLITFPLPTRPVAEPVYIWNNFDLDTSYNAAFRLDTSKGSHPKKVKMIAKKPSPPPVAAASPTPVKDYSKQYPQSYPNPNEKLDALFKKEMMK